MGNVADRQRTGHGFAGLRKRYVRRAEFLRNDREFLEGISAARREWNEEYPRYRICIGDPVDASGLSATLADDWEANRSANRQYEATQDHLELSAGSPDRVLEILRKQIQLLDTGEARAFFWWYKMSQEVAATFFPLQDFPNPYAGGHPARWFVINCLHSDPRIVEDCESLFRLFELIPVDLAAYEGDEDYMNIESAGDLLWYLPLYPGITEADLRRAAPRIVQQVNAIYENRTATARIIALRADDLTHRQIADRLGLTEQTVSATLKNADILTTENA